MEKNNLSYPMKERNKMNDAENRIRNLVRSVRKSKKWGGGQRDFFKICVRYRSKKNKIFEDWEGHPCVRDTPEYSG